MDWECPYLQEWSWKVSLNNLKRPRKYTSKGFTPMQFTGLQNLELDCIRDFSVFVFVTQIRVRTDVYFVNSCFKQKDHSDVYFHCKATKDSLMHTDVAACPGSLSQFQSWLGEVPDAFLLLKLLQLGVLRMRWIFLNRVWKFSSKIPGNIFFQTYQGLMYQWKYSLYFMFRTYYLRETDLLTLQLTFTLMY